MSQTADGMLTRKPDASLRDVTATTTSFHNLLVPVEFTTGVLPSLTTDQPSLDAAASVKLRQAVVNAINLLRRPQQTRMYVLGLVFFGSASKISMDAIFFVVDYEVLRLHVLRGIADQEYPSLAALLATLRTANPLPAWLLTVI